MNNNFIPNMNLGNNMLNQNSIPMSVPMMNPYQERMDRYVNLTQQTNQQNNINPTTNMNFVVVENMQKAKEQIVPCGYTMWMRDSSEPYQYVKSVDQVGTPSFKILKVEDVTDVSSENIQQNNNDVTYVSLQEFNNLNSKVEQLQNTINYYSGILNQAINNNTNSSVVVDSEVIEVNNSNNNKKKPFCSNKDKVVI